MTRNNRRLVCHIEGEAGVFPVSVVANGVVADLKKIIYSKGINAAHRIHATELVLLKVDIVLDDTKHPLQQPKIIEGVELPDRRSVAYFWPTQPPDDRIHVFVKLPATSVRTCPPEYPQHHPKRRRLGESPHTPPAEIKVENVEANAPFTREETEATMASALEGFENYVISLATGKLDGYLDSTRREDYVTIPGMNLLIDPGPNLLLHDLGKHRMQQRVFSYGYGSNGTTHLFTVSGSGKTRLLLEGLCQDWGLYFSCRTTRGSASGSDDFTVVTEILQTMCTWDKGFSEENAQAVYRVFSMLLCARLFILKQLVKHFPVDTDPAVARRRWVLAQILPPSLKSDGEDIFVKVLRSLRRVDIGTLYQLNGSILDDVMLSPLFPTKHRTIVNVAIDEAQVATDYAKEDSSSTTGIDVRLVLREMYGFFKDSHSFRGITISGTGLSTEVDADWSTPKTVGQYSAANSFQEDLQEDYIRRYLTLSDNVTDRRLLERMLYWFSGRYRLITSLIELFLYSENASRHRILTSFAERLTGFKLTDAISLEESEPPISRELSSKIQLYQPLCGFDRLFKKQNAEDVICLVAVLMRWTLGSQPKSIGIEGDVLDLVALGVGDIRQSYYYIKGDPLDVSEPLAVLSLSSLFEKQSWATRRRWLVDSFRNIGSNLPFEFLFEEVALVLMEIFGGKANALADAFHCSESLGSRRVTLVSLKRGADGVMQSNPVSWKTGSSDRLSLKATCPADVLTFLHNPDGKAFLFSDAHMRSDLLCFLQDEETKELIVLALQGTGSPTLDAPTWECAVDSLTPQFLYTEVAETKRGRYYAPVSYPGLMEDLKATLKTLLGPEVFESIANTYCTKLDSRTQAQPEQQSGSGSMRQTPRLLRVIADEPLQGPGMGDTVVLRWDVMKYYLGPTSEDWN